MKRFMLVCAVVVFLSLPMLASAQLPEFPCPPGLRCPTGGEGTGIQAINAFLGIIINWLLSISFGLAVLFLIIGGFRYIVSGGNEESAEKAKSTIINALIGIVLIILSYVIVNSVVNLISNAGPSPASGI